MKQLLLLSIALVTAGSLLAQNNTLYTVPQKATVASSLCSNDFSTHLFTNTRSMNPDLFVHNPAINNGAISRSASISFYPIGSSFNAFTLLHSQSTGLSADEDLNLLMFTHRACVYYTNNGGNDGWINASYSTDGGMTWDTTLLPMQIGRTTTDTGCRYPSGTIFNPAGNTTLSQAYAVVSGPYTNDTVWSGYYFGSASFTASNVGSTTNINEQIYTVDSPGVFSEYFPDVATTVAGKYVYVMGSDQYVSAGVAGEPASGKFKGTVINKGAFNSTADTFAWSQQEIHIPIGINPGDTSTQYTGAISSSDMAWSADDSVGYVIQFGVDSTQLASAGTAGYFPIVYKTIDSGKTWNKLPYFHFDTVSIFSSLLHQTWLGTYIPNMSVINGSKCVVDYNYNLHIYTDIESSATNDPDSLTYLYILPAYVFDLSTSNGTSWKCTLVDSILSAPTFTTATYSQVWQDAGTLNVAVDARIQAAITPDHTKAFVTWLDSPPGNDGINDFPDIYSVGYDFTDGFRTPAVNFTANSNYPEACYWDYVSTTAFSNSGTYTIPATMSQPGVGNNNYDVSEAMEHYFVSGITFNDSDFNALGTSGIAAIQKSNMGVAIYPNPSNGDLNVSFRQYTGQTSIIVTNILGSTVKQFSNVSIANNQISLNLEDLQSGIYFVRIETSQGSETKKVVIADKN